MTDLYRIRTGTHDASDMTSAYSILSWTVASDQTRKWVNPVTPSGRVAEYDFITDGGLSGLRRAIGKFNFSWVFGFVTPGQTQIVRANILPTNGLNEVVTVVTWDDNYGWRCINCTAHWNEPARTARAFPGHKGQFDLRIDFIDGTIANTGGDFNADFNSDFNLGGIPA